MNFPRRVERLQVASDAVSGLRNFKEEIVIESINCDSDSCTTVRLKVKEAPAPQEDVADEEGSGKEEEEGVAPPPVAALRLLAAKGDRCAFNLNRITNPPFSGLTKPFVVRADAQEKASVTVALSGRYGQHRRPHSGTL